MSRPHYIPFVRDDGGQADAGIVSTLSDDQQELVRAVAIVTGKPFAEVHAHGAAVDYCDMESFGESVSREFGLASVGALDGADMLDVAEFLADEGVRGGLVLWVRTPYGYGDYYAIVDGVQRGTEALPADVAHCEVVTAWASEADADRVEAEDEDEDDSGLFFP